MADHAHHADVPSMDYSEHERTYTGFVHIAEVATSVSLAIVAALAVGGVKHAWGTALVGTLLAVISAGVGIASDKISWRAPVAVLVLMLLALLLY
ncbi:MULTISPECIES: aa3-type cytochrome c oxidase subunit IV [Bosea]|uniref:Aa3-type cytochrome c oxidase subunit IV n=1 Tax=Bosea minatitlanensis TaxID=128782 RepID=A0ABW0F954_9HYPH|nr:aa3-type cytochrome c oxidase subunit IV [Bosea minatitlanensis]MCT4495005.1 aa3-type cytochrome c oxidase subunit IV [Bosea minatitlanensis]